MQALLTVYWIFCLAGFIGIAFAIWDSLRK